MNTIRRTKVTLLAAAVLALAQLLTVGVTTSLAVGEIRVDVCLTDSATNVLTPGVTTYRIGAGSAIYFSTAVDPTTSCKYQLFAAGTTNVTIWTLYNNTTSSQLTQDISANPVFNFQTNAITVRVQDSSSIGVAGAQVRFGGPSGTSYYFPGQPTGPSGQVAAELFPGTYLFTAGLNYTSATKSQNVGADPLVVFTTTTLTLGYSGNIAFGGATGDSAYFTPAPSREFFPGTVNFRFDFTPGGPVRLPIVIDGVALTKSMIIARLLDGLAAPIEGVEVGAEPGGISLGTTNANGVAYALVDGMLGSETVSFTYDGHPFSIGQNQPTNSIYRFSVVVTNTAPDVTLSGPTAADEGQTRTYSYGTDDPDDDTFLISTDCGANGTKSNDNQDAVTGSGSFDCTFPDGDSSSTVSVSVDDQEGDSDSDSFAVAIANVAPEISTIGGTAENKIVTVSAEFTDPGQLDSHSCSLSWGDGTETPGTVDTTTGDGTCTGSHTYAIQGEHSINVAVSDNGGGTDTGSTSVTIPVTSKCLCNLTMQYVQSSAKYQALRPFARLLTDVVVQRTCTILTNIGPAQRPAHKAQFIDAYQRAVQALVSPGWLTQGQADTLESLAEQM